MSDPETLPPTETNVAAPAATNGSADVAPAAPAAPTVSAVPAAPAIAAAATAPAVRTRLLAKLKGPEGRRARVAVLAGSVVLIGLVAGLTARPTDRVASTTEVESNENAEPFEAASRPVRPACDLLEGALDEVAAADAVVASGAEPVEVAAESRPVLEAELPAALKKPAVGLSAGLLDVADASHADASASRPESRPESRPAPVDPVDFAAAEAAYAKGEWKVARQAALRFLLRPGPLGDREEELIGRAHVRLALALARIRREEVGAADENLPEPALAFPESLP